MPTPALQHGAGFLAYDADHHVLYGAFFGAGLWRYVIANRRSAGRHGDADISWRSGIGPGQDVECLTSTSGTVTIFCIPGLEI